MRIALSLLVLLLSTPAVRADYVETEHRLKEAGLDAPLRRRIHRAIDRGVEYVLSQQGEKGNFPKPSGRRLFGDTALVPLCALALRHAGTPRAMKGAGKAVEFLFPPRSRGRSLLHDNIYVAGIALMLLMADGGHRDEAHEITGRIAGSIDARTGWWGYYTVRGLKGLHLTGRINLSTTQFAGLGLWAGDRVGASTDRQVWRRHLVSLLRTQGTKGSWGYSPIRSDTYGASYHCGTFMGTANLLLALQALKDEIGTDAEFRARCEWARERAIEALHRDGEACLDGMRKSAWNSYTLYALEKACIFADTERVGQTLWYRRGATLLCDIQLKDGSWGGGTGAFGYHWNRLIDTAFALLFLLRASESYHPATPRPIDSGRRVATEGPEEPLTRPEPPVQAAPPPPPAIGGRVEIGLAWEILKRLEGLLRENRASNEDILPTLKLVGTAYGSLRPDVGTDPAGFPAEAERWRVEAERALVVAAALRREVRTVDGNTRTAVNCNALDILALADPRVSPLLVRSLERNFLDRDTHGDVWHFAFFTLAKLGREEAFSWIVKEGVTTDRRPDRVARTLAGLRALREFEEQDGVRRLDAVKRITRRLISLEQATAAAAREIWSELDYDATETLRHLARDARTGAGPILDGSPVGTVHRFTRWLRKHDDPERPPWVGED